MHSTAVGPKTTRGTVALRREFLFGLLTFPAYLFGAFGSPGIGMACSQTSLTAVSAEFELAGNNLLPATVPQFPSTGAVRSMPPTILKAVGWVESGWRQFDASGKPLVAPDFGYGIMQITSGMPGAFGNLRGSIAPTVQASVASDFTYNIAYGAQVLVDKWRSTPRIGNGDPSVLENWYFALWAYNGWGWVNNPNNPRFTRIGTPALNPGTFPYQERVLYLVRHPPRDAAGNPMWKPIRVALPPASVIGTVPHSFTPATVHRQPVAALSAVYASTKVVNAAASALVSVPVRVENTGTLPWPSNGTLAVSLAYHLMTLTGNPWSSISPFSKGVISFAQDQTVVPRDVLPGKSVTVNMTVHSPATAGAFRLVWDLQLGTNTWFSQQGVLPLAAVLHVESLGAPTATPTNTVLPRVVKVEDAQFVRDTSFPDGTISTAGADLAKGWLLYNDGRSTWGAGWSVRHVSGAAFGLKAAPLPITPACTSLNFIATLHAPKRAGSYSGTWRVFDAHNTAVGETFTVVLTVIGRAETGTPTPMPLPSPTSTGRTLPTATPTAVG